MRSIPFSSVRAALGLPMFGRLGVVSSDSRFEIATASGETMRLSIPAGTVVRLQAGDLVLDTGTNPTER